MNKANKTLGFVQRNLSDCSAPVKSAAYTTMVRPRLEYSFVVWDPHHNGDIHNLEQVQRRAARFVNLNYTERTPGCVTNMIQSIGWESLQHRRYINRLTMLFKIQHGIIDISPDLVQLNDHRTRGSKHLRHLPATNDAYKFSFYPRAMVAKAQNRPPEPSGIQGCPCKPPSRTPNVQLDPQLPVNSFNGELGRFYLLLSGIAVLYRV